MTKSLFIFTASLVTVTVYTVADPSSAVTVTEIAFAPVDKEMFPEADPDTTAVPLTLTVDVDSVTAGVIVIELIEFDTVDVYERVAEAKEGERLNTEPDSEDNVLTVPILEFLVTVIL